MVQPHRIVSLIPSATEIVCELGFRDELVGRSHECDFPADVTDLPACSQPIIDTDASSQEINLQVSERVRDAMSLFEVDYERLAELEPTVIITQDQCEVCAVSLDIVEEMVCDTIPSDPVLVACNPSTLNDLQDDIFRIGMALDAEPQAEALISKIDAHWTELLNQTASLESRPRVACIEWIDPLMVSANWIPELIDVAGGESLFGTAGELSTRLEWDALKEADPEVIIIMPCGFEIERSLSELEPLVTREGWKELSAVKNGRVALVDGHNYLNRPGPRIIESTQIVMEILHPGKFDYGHQGTGWIPLEV
ncbi:MAG: cobalamin-binding protein [Planctomycetaceae bacterium]|nr:cobalamin-binding protein [Planctomycetaceae bacterium]